MQERIDALTAAGAQNVWPKFIHQRRNEAGDVEHVLVAEVIDDACYLTDEGKALLDAKPEDIVDAEVISERPRRRKKNEIDAQEEKLDIILSEIDD